MRTQQPLQTVSIKAAAALANALRFVGFDGNYAAANAGALGVLDAPVGLGEMASVNTYGIVLVETGAAVTQGASIVATTDGKAIPATALSATVAAGSTAVKSTAESPATTIAGSVPPQIILGQALDAANGAGEFIRIKLR